jgi:hypothetical protein
MKAKISVWDKDKWSEFDESRLVYEKYGDVILVVENYDGQYVNVAIFGGEQSTHEKVKEAWCNIIDEDIIDPTSESAKSALNELINKLG